MPDPLPGHARPPRRRRTAPRRAGASPRPTTLVGRFDAPVAACPELADLMRRVPLPGMTPPPVDPAGRAGPRRSGPPARTARGRAEARRTMAAEPEEAASFTGTLKRTPFAQVLQRLYVTRATGSLLLLARADQEARRRWSDGYPVSVRSNVLAECLGQFLLEKQPHHARRAGGLGRPHAEREAAAGADPGRDGRAVAVQPAARAGRAARVEAAGGLHLGGRQVPVQAGTGGAVRRRAPRAHAGRI